MDDHHQSVLPPEIWLRILNIAVLDDVDPRADEHRPFQPTPDQRLGANVALVAQLAQVCRTWHTWLIPTLYRDVKLSQEPISLPQHVKRVVLPYASTSYHYHPDPSAVVENLRQCTQVEILCRPRPTSAEQQAFSGPPMIPLPSLQRLEWYIVDEADDPIEGGINSFVDVALQCPNLRYLSLSMTSGEDIPHRFDRLCAARMLKLETLRICADEGRTINALSQSLVLPVLKTLIIDRGIEFRFLRWLVRQAGHTLTRLELGDGDGFDYPLYLSILLIAFPALQDLGYHLCVTEVPAMPPLHLSIRRIRLRLGKLEHGVGDELVLAKLRNHCDSFNQPGMKSLTTFIFHGQEEWSPFMKDPQWQIIVESITTQGRNVVLDWEETF